MKLRNKKLRNKKTGEIGELHFEPDKEYHFTVATEDPADVMIYKKLADLYADWEDYKEPKLFYVVDLDGEILPSDFEDETIEKAKELGNYFETEEEAEKAVECLRAWKRLKDMGFKIKGIRYRNYKNYIEWDISQKVSDDHFTGENFNDALHLLFRGEE